MSAAEHICIYRVPPGETDSSGIHYISWPVEWFEYARTEMLRTVGLSHALLEQRGMRLMLAGATNTYQGRARAGDQLKIRTRLAMCDETMLRFDVKVTHAAGDDPVAEGGTVHAMMGLDGQPIPLPDWLKKKLRMDRHGRKSRKIAAVTKVHRKKAPVKPALNKT